MKIKTKLFLAASFLIGAIIVIALVVFVSTQQVNTASQKEDLAHQLVQEVFKLNVLTTDYQLHQEERAKIQWHNQHKKIETLLDDPHIFLSDPVAQQYSTRIKQDLLSAHRSFIQLDASMQKEQTSLEDRIVGQLQITLQSIVTDATQLAEHAQQERQNAKQMADWLLFIFIVGGNLTMLFATYFFYRSVVVPIAALDAVVQKVQKGDLTPRARVSSADEIGQFSLTFNTMLDELKQSQENLEKKVEERTKELQAVNKDLEAFSYSVSHDLRSPLRAIDGFSQILQEDYAKDVDEKGKEVIATIRKGAKYMAELIDDLLAFSRLGRQEINTQTVDMNQLVHEIFTELLQSTPERKIHFTCASLPQIQADASLLRHVWVNLLSNAIKYTKNKKDAVISVGFTDEPQEIIYFIKDNGAGFDMKYVGKLFGVFQRLHSRRDFEGTGVGLAIVSRVIAKHGGRVWAEGVVDGGATFYFSLPKHIAISEQKTYPKKEGNSV